MGNLVCPHLGENQVYHLKRAVWPPGDYCRARSELRSPQGERDHRIQPPTIGTSGGFTYLACSKSDLELTPARPQGKVQPEAGLPALVKALWSISADLPLVDLRWGSTASQTLHSNVSRCGWTLELPPYLSTVTHIASCFSSHIGVSCTQV